MIHDRDLVERLGALPVERYTGDTFRATRPSLDPRAFSTRGGRWARMGGASVLYTSLERDGALAEISFHWGQLTPLPTKPVMLHRLRVSTRNTRRLIRADLAQFGIDPEAFGALDYERTQAVGEAVAFLECDGADRSLGPLELR